MGWSVSAKDSGSACASFCQLREIPLPAKSITLLYVPSADFFLVNRSRLVRVVDGRFDLLTCHGWLSAPRWVRRAVLLDKAKALNSEKAKARLARACCPIDLEAERLGWSPSELGRVQRVFAELRNRRPLAWFGLPLGQGAPRFLDSSLVGVDSFQAELGDNVDEETVAAALNGYEVSRSRLYRIEDRTGTVLQLSGLTGTLLLANAGLIIGGDSGLAGFAKVLTVWALTLGSIALVAAGLFSLAGLNLTFDRVAPDVSWRILKRSQQDPLEARRKRVATILTAQRRTQLIADWKIARLKRASVALVVTVASVAVASAAIALQAL